MEYSERVKVLLVDFFSLITRYIVEIHQTYESGKFSDGKLKEYTYGEIVERTRNLNRSIFAYVCFIEGFVNWVIKWFEFFSSLVKVLGINGYYPVFHGKVKLEEVIDESQIDTYFLKFQIRIAFNTRFQELSSISKLLLEEAKSVRDKIVYLRSKSSEEFINIVENQARRWNVMHGEISGLFQFLIKEEDKHILVETLIIIINKCIDFFAKISEVQKFLKIPEEVWENYMAGDFVELFERFKNLKEDIIKFFEYSTKVYEYVSRCFLQVLIMLWGAEEEARRKLELLVKSEITVDDLVPENFSLKDIEFGLNLAIFEWDQARFAGQVLDEKKDAIELLANYISTEEMQKLYKGIMKRFELRNKYRKEIYDKMLEIQNAIHKMMSS